MKKEDAEEFTQSLGQIVGGSWRQIALAKRLGVPQALGLPVDEWVSRRLGGYVKMSVEDRRKAVEELAAEGASTREIGEVLGVTNVTVHRDLHSEDGDRSVTNETPLDAVAALAADSKLRSSAQATETRQAKIASDAAEFNRTVTAKLPEGVNHGDFRDLSVIIPDNSVDLIFTDPPYDRESVGLYEDAAKVATRILKPGGSFIAYGGQYLLPEILSGCGKHLRLWWINACIHGGGGQLARMKEYGVVVHWKPMVWFVKGTRGDKQTFVDDAISGSREKDYHPWQQNEEQAAYYIEKLTRKSGLVVDFFLGGGTTAVAAEKLGRQWIGFEINPAHAEKCASRIHDVRKKAA